MSGKQVRSKHIKENRHLFVGFFRVGVLGYGGGPGSIPLIHKEVVDKYKWMTDEDFSDLLALANALPGPIATKLPGYIGYRVTGIAGMLISILATILPTIFLIIILLNTLSSFKDFNWVKGMTAAVIPVVGVMLGSLTIQFFTKAVKGMGFFVTILLSAAVFIALYFLNVHPGMIIAVLLVAALVQKDRSEKDSHRQKEENAL